MPVTRTPRRCVGQGKATRSIAAQFRPKIVHYPRPHLDDPISLRIHSDGSACPEPLLPAQLGAALVGVGFHLQGGVGNVVAVLEE